MEFICREAVLDEGGTEGDELGVAKGVADDEVELKEPVLVGVEGVVVLAEVLGHHLEVGHPQRPEGKLKNPEALVPEPFGQSSHSEGREEQVEIAQPEEENRGGSKEVLQHCKNKFINQIRSKIT